jgi:hypothetical protein
LGVAVAFDSFSTTQENALMSSVSMPPLLLAELLVAAAGVTSDEEKARVLMRARDTMWRNVAYWGVSFTRSFGELVEELIEDDARG